MRPSRLTLPLAVAVLTGCAAGPMHTAAAPALPPAPVVMPAELGPTLPPAPLVIQAAPVLLHLYAPIRLTAP